MMKDVRRNQGQISLLGVLVVSVAAIGGLMAMTGLFKSSMQAQRTVQGNADVTQLSSLVSLIISNSKICGTAFWDGEGGTANPSAAQIAYFNPDDSSLAPSKAMASIRLGSKNLQVGSTYDAITIQSMALTELNSGARVVNGNSTTYLTNLNISTVRNGTKAYGNPQSSNDFPFYVTTDNTTHQITGCSLTVNTSTQTTATSTTGKILQMVYSTQAKTIIYPLSGTYQPSGFGISIIPSSKTSHLIVECTFNLISAYNSLYNTTTNVKLVETTPSLQPPPNPKTKKPSPPPTLASGSVYCLQNPVGCFAAAPSALRGIVDNTDIIPRTFEIYGYSTCAAGLSQNGAMTSGVCTAAEISD